MRTRPTIVVALLAVVAGCGARTGLDVDGPAAGSDAGPRRDAGTGHDDAGVPPMDAGVDPPPCVGSFGPVAGPYTIAVTPENAAFDPDLVATPGGMLATWRVGFDGLDPPPTNVFARTLDADGRPVGDEMPLLERPVTNGPRAAPAADARIVLGYCGRYGAEDHATSAFVDRAGGLVGSDARREPTARWCSGMTPDVVWTGRRHLFGWMNGDGPGPTYVVVDVFDGDGRSVRTDMLHEDGDGVAPPRFARGHGRVAMVAGIQPGLVMSRLVFHLLDAEGRDSGTPRILEPPGDGRWSDAHVVTQRDGWLIVGANRFDSGLYAARIAPDGRVVAPTRVVEGLPDRYDDIDVVARRSDEAVVAGNEDRVGGGFGGIAMLLDGTGALRAVWRPDPADEEWLGWPALLVRDGRVFMLYTSPSETRPYELRLLELGCRPEG